MNPRLAAGAGVVSVFFLLSGSGAAVAYAHPGDSRGSDRGHSSDRGGSHGRGSNNGKHDNDRRDGNRPGGSKQGGGLNRPGAAPESRVGSGREDLKTTSGNRLSVAPGPETAGRAASSPQPAARVASTPQPEARVAAGPESANRSAVAGVAPVVEAPVGIASVAGPVAAGGSGAAGALAPAFEPPQVTFGNGRTPQSRGPAPEAGGESPAVPAPAVPAPALPAPMPPESLPPLAPTPLSRDTAPPAVVRQFVVAPGAGTTDPLWGIAGLLVIPVAGAALGYRQARAAQAAERIGRS
ncbi:hypothetical protein [Mycobacterium sp. 852002-51961_SCH5331710]|uniref:hypothetical protein n=1 Tax=Mycobacterium sp. 852002-51961_SCH5331710 TaxID=1834105 RepID=UPI0007FD69FD|nr:hypothetical protein [Mycobacterium sp. 852002-51961_SCH5331710]OBB35025.1 hypothetical protein A5752_20915 [Mycobacterium sp. 852002-51961_SCH5331710]